MKCAKCGNDFVVSAGGMNMCDPCIPKAKCKACGQTFGLPEIVEMTGRCITCEALTEIGPGAQAIGSVSEETLRDLELGREIQEGKGRLRGIREERADIVEWLALYRQRLQGLMPYSPVLPVIWGIMDDIRRKRHKKDRYFEKGMDWEREPKQPTEEQGTTLRAMLKGEDPPDAR